jgi:YesN/AraC family two-component response regulator
VGPLDILVTDIVMPGGIGAALAERLRADRPTLPVLFVSGYFREGPPLSTSTYLEKPFDAATLVRAVERVAARRSAAA